MLKNIFLDLDDTILNFTAGEAKALSQTLREAGDRKSTRLNSSH